MLFEKQQYQEDCVANIVAVLENCDGLEYFSSLEGNLKQLQKGQLQKGQAIPVTDLTSNPRLDIVMETGTGKTFAYLKTIFEINKRFRKNKFIIVLPRTAIKLGVIQNIKLTDEYFFNEYGKHLNYIDYPKEGLSSIQQNFITSNDLSVLITTNSAFADDTKKNKIIRRKSENLFDFGSTWDGIAAKKPIVIIDEPHLLTGTETQKGLNELKHSLFIRFGATYPKDESHKLSNVVYALDSISAFNNYLVKRIGVNTVFANSEVSGLTIHNIQANKSFDALYNINEQLHKATVSIHDDLGAKTGLNQYRGASVAKISLGKVFLDNHITLAANSGNYALSDEEMLQMIKRTLIVHFEKEQTLFELDVKALSLFFIAKVDDFRGENPRIKNMFECEYKIIHRQIYQTTTNEKYKRYLEKDYQDGELKVAEGYFSGDKGSADKKESDGVNTILNEKEKLLSFATPLRFIFSVWALQEGWDNPNIFTICKLSSSGKEISRRQQVGRGLRIAVNQAGRRLTYKYCCQKERAFYGINTLDMVVSGHEQDFVHSIQNEIQVASFSAGDIITHKILNAVTDKNIKPIQKKRITINKKSKIVYRNIQQEKLIDEISHAFNEEKIATVKIKITKEIYNTQKNRVEAVSEATEGNIHYFQGQKLNQFIVKFAKDENLPLFFTLKLFKKLKLEQFYKDPKKSQDMLKSSVKNVIQRSIIQNK